MSQINVNTIKDKSGLGAPSFPNGVNATGVITATSFSGDGGNLTGIDASSLRVGGTTIVQASSTGLVITGVATASNFKTGSTNVHNTGIEAAGINVLGADTPIGTGSTIYDNGNAFFNGTVTAASYAGVGGTVTVSTSTGINRWHWSTGGHLIPNVNAAYDIGNAERKVRHLFLSDNSLKFVDDSNNPRNLSVTAGGNLKFDGGFEATSAIFAGNVSVGGTLTYEDVTNIDSVGLITARGGVRVTSGGMVVAGISTFSGALDINAGVNLSGLGDFAACTFNNIRAAWSGDGEIDTSSGNLTLDSAGGTVVVDDNLTVNGATTLGSPSANNTTFINSSTAANSEATTLVVGHGSGNYAGMTFQCAAGYPGGVYFTDTDNGKQGGMAYYHIGDQLRFYAGSTQYMSVDSSAITAVNSVPFVGNLTGNVTGNTSGSSGSCTGNALTATTLQNARTIAGVSFNGSANISLNNNAITNGAGYITSSGISGGFSAGNASNLNSGTVPSARLGSSGTRSSSTYLRGDNTWADDGCFIRADAADTATGRITFSGNATSNHDDMASTTGSMGSIEVYNQGSGNDAFMAFHSGSDYALYFGLDADTNNLSVGGWSMGANKYKIWHAGNDGSGSTLDADLLDGIDSSSFLRSDANDSASGSYNFTNSYNAFGNSTGSVSNDGSWNARVNVAGTTHARLDVKSVSDGIITSMLSHTGHGAGKIGTRSAHDLKFLVNNNDRATLTTGGAFSVTDTISDSKGNVRSVPYKNEGSSYTLVAADAGKCITHSSTITVPNGVFAAGDVVTLINNTGSDQQITQGSSLTMRNTGDDGSTGNVSVKTYAMTTIYFTSSGTCWFSTTAKA